MDSPQASVLVVENHPLMREALCLAIQEEPLLTVYQLGSDEGDDYSAQKSDVPNLVLFSVETPNIEDIQAIQAVRTTFPDIPPHLIDCRLDIARTRRNLEEARKDQSTIWCCLVQRLHPSID